MPLQCIKELLLYRTTSGSNKYQIKQIGLHSDLFWLHREFFLNLCSGSWLLCQETAECVLPASSGSSVWGEQCHVQTSQWSSAETARRAVSVHTGLSNRWWGTAQYKPIDCHRRHIVDSFFISPGGRVCERVWLPLSLRRRTVQTRRRRPHRLQQLASKTLSNNNNNEFYSTSMRLHSPIRREEMKRWFIFLCGFIFQHMWSGEAG